MISKLIIIYLKIDRVADVIKEGFEAGITIALGGLFGSPMI